QRRIVVKPAKKILRPALFPMAAAMLVNVFPSTASAAPQCVVSALYAAINAANNSNTNNVINLFPCVYTLNAGPLNVSSTITINGNGATVDGASSSSVFVVTNPGNLTLNNLKVTNGSNIIGGGIINGATVTLNASSITGNNGQFGAGILNAGTLTL